MKKHYLLIISYFLLTFFPINAGVIYSFEDGTVPSNFKVKKGALKIQQQKAKLGTKSLQWDWVAGDSLIASPTSMNTASIKNAGGITVWIYNENPINQPLTMWFYEFANSTTKRCSLKVNLNFKGWRYITARFRQDMGHPGYTLRSMKWEAPNSGSGSIYIDYLEFVDNVSWERMSDFQYTVNNSSSDLVDFKGIYNAISTTTPSTSITESQRAGIQTIKTRLNDWYYGTTTYAGNPTVTIRRNTFNNYVNSAKNRTSQLQLTKLPDGTVQGAGLFPLDFHNRTIDGVAVKSFRSINEQFLVQLAYDAVKNNNATSKQLVSDIFDWYYDQGWAVGSGLGTLRFEMLRSSGYFHAAYLFNEHFSAEQSNRVNDANKWFTLYGKMYQQPTTAGENADEIRTLLLPKLFTVLSLKNEAEMADGLQKFVSYTENAFALAGGFLDCFKPDYSGYHHRGVYFNAYYPEAIYTAALVYYLLADTPYALSQTTYENLKNSLLTFQFISSDYNVPGSTTGRFPTQTQVLEKVLPAFAYLALSTSEPDKDLTAAFKSLWKPNEEPVKSFISRVTSDITFKATIGEVEKMVELAEKATAVNPVTPLGVKILPYAGLFMSRNEKWTLSMKGYSKYIWDYEASASENLYGRYLSYGHVQFSKLNSSVNSFQPTNSQWDWSHIPGTTVKYLTKTELNFSNTSKHRNFSDDPFLGGTVMDNNTAVFSNSIHDNTFYTDFYAKKSVFQFDSLYYFIGSGIENTDNSHGVHTTLFQNQKISSTDNILLNGNVITNSQTNTQQPVIVDNYNNAYFVKAGNTVIDFGSNFITAYINHGNAVSKGLYGYLMVPDISQNDLSTLSSNKDNILQVLKHDSKTHAVYYEPKHTLALAVFDASAPIDLKQVNKVNIPMTLILKEQNDTLHLAFTDPDMHRPSATDIGKLTNAAIIAESQPSTIKIELNGEYEKQDSSDPEISSRIENGKTIIEYVKAKDGKTYFISLEKKDSNGIEIIDKPSFSICKTDKNKYSIKPASSDSYNIILYNTLGKILINNKNLQGEQIISLENYPSGVFVLNITSNNRKKNVKIIK